MFNYIAAFVVESTLTNALEEVVIQCKNRFTDDGEMWWAASIEVLEDESECAPYILWNLDTGDFRDLTGESDDHRKESFNEWRKCCNESYDLDNSNLKRFLITMTISTKSENI